MRRLTAIEEKRLAVFTGSAASVALLEITETGLAKSIMDATGPLRRLLAETGVHDYATQAKGQANKAILPATIHFEGGPKGTKASLYRPETKNGDPRIWFYGLKEFASPGDVLAIIPHDGELHLANITSTAIEGLARQQGHSVQALLAAIVRETNAVADELLAKLREIAAKGPAPSLIDGKADTAIGRTLEHLLGIGMNSSKVPDYKGIELKSFRKRKKSAQTRKTLFAQVPDWTISKLKSSAEILDAFGYNRNGEFRLYCQVEATKRNSQGLMLRLESADGLLWENSDKPAYGDFAAWQVAKLLERLNEKHNETFWVGAKAEFHKGREYFQFTEVIHTRRPIPAQFEIALEQGAVSLDHLIKRKKDGKANEKGPLFKMRPGSLGLIFPPPQIYSL